MLGYVKCDAGELLVRQHRLYRALYCGLCRSGRKHFGIASSPFHSYDFVFLAAARLLSAGESITVEKHRCPTHPFRKRPMAADCGALTDTAFCQLVMIREKMRDDLKDRDAGFFRRILCRLWLPLLNGEIRRAGKKDPAYAALADTMEKAFEESREKERRQTDLDGMCSDFAGILSALASFRTAGTPARILSGLGDRLGRFLYTIDAVDDLPRDAKKGAFNPVLLRFGGLEGALDHLSELEDVEAFYLREMELALALAEGDRDLLAICENVVTRGLWKEKKRVWDKRKGQTA